MKIAHSLVGRFITILAIPVIFTLLCLCLKFAVGPYYLGLNNDPSYLYLMNSMYLLNGLTPGFIQHPGITLQVFGAIAIQAFHLNHAFGVIVESVFRDPEFYLHSIYYSILVMNAVSLAILGWYAASKTGNLVLGVLAQASAFLVVNWGTPDVLMGGIPVVANINAENFLIGITNVYGILLLKLYFDEKENPKVSHDRVAALMGFLCATGFVTKILFLPWVLMPLLLLPKQKEKWMFVAAFLSGVGLWIIPILKSIPGFLQWHFMAMTHTGVHGSGEKGLIDIHLYAQGLIRFLRGNTFYFSFVAALGSLVIVSFFAPYIRLFKSNLNFVAWRYLAMLCLTVLMALLTFARQPEPHYIVPTINFFGLICFFACLTWEHKEGKRFLAIALAVGIAANVFLSLRTAGELGRINRDIYNFSQKVYRDYKECTVCSYYRSSSPAFALQFGDDNQGHKAYVDVLRKVYPDAYFYHYWNRYFHDGRDVVYYEDLIKRLPCVLLYGSRLGDQFNQGFIKVHEIASSRSEVLYRVDAVTAYEALEMYANAKHYESVKQYTQAYTFAKKAKALGLRSIDPYMKHLEGLMTGVYPNP